MRIQICYVNGLITVITPTTKNLTVWIGKNYFIIELHFMWANTGENLETEENESVNF